MQLLGYVYITVALVILGSVGDNYAHLVLIIKDSAGSFPDGWTCVKFFSFLLSVRFFFSITDDRKVLQMPTDFSHFVQIQLKNLK